MKNEFAIFVLCSIVATGAFFIGKDKGLVEEVAGLDESSTVITIAESSLEVMEDNMDTKVVHDTVMDSQVALVDDKGDVLEEHVNMSEDAESSDADYIDPYGSAEAEDYEVTLQHEFEFSEEPGEDNEAWQRYAEYFSASPVKGLSMSNLECHQFTCRVEFAVEKPDAHEELLQRLGEVPLDKGGTFYLSDDNRRLVIFAKHQLQDAKGG